ncbi:hypothetical protein [Streptomyces sp. ISL-12]|uniref:hypothetical protein n=1 Tax=Streptomyces sp. ISL-12 TaxID=2819177 RepID=UPI0027DEE0EC|nr:hypothetical protein [Streptomyces sp. ISL-12]
MGVTGAAGAVAAGPPLPGSSMCTGERPFPSPSTGCTVQPPTPPTASASSAANPVPVRAPRIDVTPDVSPPGAAPIPGREEDTMAVPERETVLGEAAGRPRAGVTVFDG